jgi:di- and tripeptidase
VHEFFNSYPQYQRRPADLLTTNNVPGRPLTTGSDDSDSSVRAVFHVSSVNVISSAHYGYIYCMAIWPSCHVDTDDVQSQQISSSSQSTVHLVTGSGDESVKVRRTGLIPSRVF